jgi:hypothetical protein
MKICRGGGMAPRILAPTLDRGEWSASRPCRFTPGIHCIGSCLGPRAYLDAVEYRQISCPYLDSNPDRIVRSPSLYRLRYHRKMWLQPAKLYAWFLSRGSTGTLEHYSGCREVCKAVTIQPDRDLEQSAELHFSLTCGGRESYRFMYYFRGSLNTKYDNP